MTRIRQHAPWSGRPREPVQDGPAVHFLRPLYLELALLGVLGSAATAGAVRYVAALTGATGARVLSGPSPSRVIRTSKVR